MCGIICYQDSMTGDDVVQEMKASLTEETQRAEMVGQYDNHTVVGNIAGWGLLSDFVS